MKKSRNVALAIGIVLALGTGLMLLDYIGSVRSAEATALSAHPVLVASRDIPARALLTDAYVAQTMRPAKAIDPDAVTERKDLNGKYSLITIPAGSVITRSKIGAGGANALPARLPIGMRAVSISIDRVKGVAGLIQPGDRVDVIAVPPRVGTEVPRAAAILRGVLVLAMGNEVETTSATPSPENQNLTTVTLALTPAQVDLLAAADLNTTLRLALRPPKEPVNKFNPETLSLGTPERATVPHTAPALQRPTIAIASRSVTVIDGDRVADPTAHP